MSARIDPVLAIRGMAPAEALELLARLLIEGKPLLRWRRDIATAMRVVAREVAR